MKALLIFSLLLMAAFVVLSCIFVGVPEKYSDWLKGWKEKLPGFPLYLSGIVTIIALFAALPSILEVTKGSPWQFLGFLAGFVVVFTQLSNRFASGGFSKGVYAFLDLLFAVLAILWVILACKLWPFILGSIVVFYIVAGVTKTISRSWLFWLEISAIGAAYVAMLI